MAPKRWTKAQLVEILKRASVPFKASSKRDDLLQLCHQHGFVVDDVNVASMQVEHPPSDPPLAYVEKEKLVIVKCSLRRAMCLSDAEFDRFQASVNGFVNVVSRALRRSSLVFNAYLTDLLHRGVNDIPDMYNQKDTYWKRWLTVGTIRDKENRLLWPSPDVEPVYTRVHALVGKLYGATTGGDDAMYLRAAPKHFDQVLNYAGHTFSTAVANNAWVPLFARLQRVTKELLRTRFSVKGETYNVMKAIRGCDDPTLHPSFKAWPEELQRYIVDVRARLGAVEGKYLADDHGKTVMAFGDVMRFNYWMQTILGECGARRIALSPVFNVHRAHVRLDKKTLLAILGDLFPADKNMNAVKTMVAAHERDKERGGMGHTDPNDCMLPKAPAARRKAEFKDDEEGWIAHKAALDAHKDEVERIKATDAYLTQKTIHDAYEAAQRLAIASFFRNMPKKRSKTWVFDCSVATDGVAVSLQFSSKVRVPAANAAAKKNTKKRRITNHDEVLIVDEYKRDMETRFEVGDPSTTSSTVVLGLDPGRNNIATVACVVYNLNEKTNALERCCTRWKLSRGHFYTTSGIRKQDRSKRERFTSLLTRFSSLGGDDAALRTDNVAAILKYLEAYAMLHDEWWTLALKTVESMAFLTRYAGKRRVLDGFFANVKKEAEKTFEGARIVVAYGSAMQTMKATGPGEVAAPVGPAFEACCRVFGRSNVSVTDESYSTKMSWETGQAKHLVYRTFVRDGNNVIERLQSTSNDTSPVAEGVDNVEMVMAFKDRIKDAGRRRRGGIVELEALQKWQGHKAINDCEKKKSNDKTRYPEVRGLRFCPEDRKFRDRDVEAALTIGRLCCMKLQGHGRPRPFCRARA